jgi:hypothetical protein
MAEVDDLTTIVNVAALTALIMITLCNLCMPGANWFTCPVLTCLVFFYSDWIESHDEVMTNLFKIGVSLAASFVISALCNEMWLISSLAFTPLASFYIWQASGEEIGTRFTDLHWLVLSVACSLLYAIASYRVEKLLKKEFIGRESAFNAYHDCLKVFKTFPEGIALTRLD